MKLQKSRILLIGDSCQDIYRYGRTYWTRPESPTPTFKRTREVSFPGMAGNVMANLVGLGNYVDFVTNQGTVPQKIRYLEESTGKYLFREDDGEDLICPVSFKTWLTPSLVGKYDAVIVSDYNAGLLPPSTLQELFDVLTVTKRPVFVDTKKKDLSHYPKSIIKINENESKISFNLPESSKLLVTRGESGADWEGTTFPSCRVSVGDPCGAGDTFLAGLVTGYLTFDRDMTQAIKFANYCASIAVSKPGTYAVTVSDVTQNEGILL